MVLKKKQPIVDNNQLATVFSFGNRCGHMPHQPRLQLEKPIGDNVPYLLRKVSELLPKWYWNPSYCYKILKIGSCSERRIRSEFREAIIKLLLVLIKYLDLSSMQIGYATAQGFVPFTLSFLADKAGLSYKRTQRALTTLTKSGLIKAKRISYIDARTEQYRSYTIRTLSRALFTGLGIAAKTIKKGIKAAKQRIEKKRMQASQKLFSHTNAYHTQRFNPAASNTSVAPKTPDKIQLSVEDERKRIALLRDIIKAHPGISIKEAKAMLDT